MSTQYDRFNSLFSDHLAHKETELTSKAHYLAAHIWELTIDYANSTGFPNTLGFLQYIWAGFYFCIRDIIRINGIEHTIKKAFTDTTSAIFHIREDEKYIFSSILENQDFILESLSNKTTYPITKEAIVTVQDTVLFLAAMDLDDEPFVPDAHQEFEFVIAATSVIKFAASAFPNTKPSSPKVHTIASSQSDNDSRVYFIRSFDGRSFNIPGSAIDEFRYRDKENESNYIKKYGALHNQLFNYLRESSHNYLKSYASVHNRESFMYLSTAVLCSSSSLSEHYVTVSKIYQDIIAETMQFPTDVFCMYRSEKTLFDAQFRWIGSLKSTYNLNFQSEFHADIIADEKSLKKYAKEVFHMSAPRSHYGFKSQKALIALLRDFDHFVKREIATF